LSISKHAISSSRKRRRNNKLASLILSGFLQLLQPPDQSLGNELYAEIQVSNLRMVLPTGWSLWGWRGKTDRAQTTLT
jgi:hypothetical protein